MEIAKNTLINGKNLLIKHSLKTDLKGVLDTSGEIAYPVYVLISYDRTVFQFRSRYLHFYVTPSFFQASINNSSNIIQYLHSKEVEVINYTVHLISDVFSRPVFRLNYEFLSNSLRQMLDLDIKQKGTMLSVLYPQRQHVETLMYFTDFEQLFFKQQQIPELDLQHHFISVYDWKEKGVAKPLESYLSQTFVMHKVNKMLQDLDQFVIDYWIAMNNNQI